VKTNFRFLLISTTIVCLAAYLRLNRLDLIDFRFDQAYPLQYALDIVEGRKVWLVQPHGSVAQHPPIYIYFIALGLLFTRNFMAMVVYRILWDVLAVVLCGWFCARYLSRRVAVIAMLLYAVAPWAIQFSRNLWPVPQPLFTIILFIGLGEVVALKNTRGWFWVAVGIGLVAGTHLAGVYVLPAVIVISLYALRSFKVMPFALGSMVPAFAFGAYFFHDAQNGFNNTKNLVSTFGSPSHFDLRPMWQTLNLSGGTKLSDLTGIAYPQWVAESPSGFEYIDTLQIALFVASVIVVLFFVLHRTMQREPLSAFVAASTVVFLFWTLTLAVQLRQNDSRPTEVQYLTMLYPAPFILVGIAFDIIASSLKNSARRIVMSSLSVALLAIVGWHVWTTIRFTRFVEFNNTTGGYGLPVKSAWFAAQRARTHATQKAPLIIALNGFALPWNEQAAVLRAVLADVPHRFYNIEDNGMIFRPDETFLLMPPDAGVVLEQLRTNTTSIETESLPIQPRRDGYVFARGQTSLPFSSYTKTEAEWENGLALKGYRFTPQDRLLKIEMLFEVKTLPPPNADYHWFAHVFVGEEKIGARDGQGVHPSSWRIGDLVTIHFEIELSRALVDSAYVRLGSYTFPEIKPVRVVQDNRAPEDGLNLLVKQR
jgi:hypothetical protein